MFLSRPLIFAIMIDANKGRKPLFQGLVDDFKFLSTKQWIAIIVVLAIDLLLEVVFNAGCFGYLIIAIVLYMVPHLLGVFSVKVKAVVGVVFIVLAVPTLTYVFSGTPDAVAEQQEKDEYIVYLEYITNEDDPYVEDVMIYVKPYVDSDGNTLEEWQIMFQCYYAQSLTYAINGSMSTLAREVYFNLNEYTLDDDGTCHLTVEDLELDEGKLYVMGTFILVDGALTSHKLIELYDTGYNVTRLSLTGAGYTVLYAMVIYFLILVFSALMRNSAKKTRVRMEADGRLYPQGYGRCKQCGAIVLPGEINCRKCSTYIDVPEELRVKKKDSFQCSECGVEVPPDATVCPKCGVAFDEEDENEVVHHDGTVDVSTENVTCLKCGNIVPANADWCPRCGKMLEKKRSPEDRKQIITTD